MYRATAGATRPSIDSPAATRRRISVADTSRLGPRRIVMPGPAARSGCRQRLLGWRRRARTRSDRDADEAEEALRVVPGRQPGERVGRQDHRQVQLAAGRLGRVEQRRHRVDRPRGPLAVDLDPARPESLFARDRELDHRQPVQRRRHRDAQLVRRLAGRDHEHLVEPELPPGRLGDRDVGDVDRVEGPAEDADAGNRDGARPVAAPRRASVTAPPTAGPPTRARSRRS